MFTIIIPLYNKEKYIGDTLDSVLSQTYTNYELIVVNDSSTDKSLSIVQKYKDPRIKVFSKTNGGVSAARNYGIEKAIGEYICFLDADDMWEENYLEELYRLTYKYQDAGMFCGAYKMFRDERTNIVRESNLKDYIDGDDAEVDFFKLSTLTKGLIALTSRVCVKKESLLRLDGLFPVGISMGEDADVWVRLAANNRVVYSTKPLMLYRLDVAGLTFNGKSFSASYPYWKWYSIKSSNPYKNKITTRKVYALAKKGVITKDFDSAKECLKRVEGNYMIFRRVILYIRIILKI